MVKPVTFTLILWAFALLTGCASIQIQPFGKEHSRKRISFALLEPAKVSLKIPVRASKNCQQYLKYVNVRLTSDKKDPKGKFARYCDKKGKVVLQSRSYLKKGEHSLRLVVDKSRHFKDHYYLDALYRTANFDQEKDHLFDTAKPMPAGQSIEGKFSYYEGDRTDWLEVKGKKLSAKLTLLTEGPAKANVYRKVGKILQPLGELKPNKGRTFAVHADDVYVRVRAQIQSKPGSYNLLRKDTTLVETVPVSIIDVYPVSNASTVIMVEAIDGLSKGHYLNIFAKRGKKALGKCRVLSVADGQASCRLDRTVNHHSSLRARAIVGG